MSKQNKIQTDEKKKMIRIGKKLDKRESQVGE